MKNKFVLLGSLALLSACADTTPLETYSAYLNREPCSATVTEECRDESVVKTMSTPVAEFGAAASVFYSNKDNLTLEISKDFIEKKNTFEDLVETLIEGE